MFWFMFELWIFLALGCGGKERSLEGVYYMTDLRAMKAFVQYPTTPSYQYCMEFRPRKNLARVKFLDSSLVYELKIEKKGKDDFVFTGPSGIRKAKIVAEKSMPGNFWNISVYFEDSNPYREEAKRMNIPYDGGKDPAWKTLDDCVQAQINHLKEAEEQSYPTLEEAMGGKK